MILRILIVDDTVSYTSFNTDHAVRQNNLILFHNQNITFLFENIQFFVNPYTYAKLSASLKCLKGRSWRRNPN